MTLLASIFLIENCLGGKTRDIPYLQQNEITFDWTFIALNSPLAFPFFYYFGYVITYIAILNFGSHSELSDNVKTNYMICGNAINIITLNIVQNNGFWYYWVLM